MVHKAFNFTEIAARADMKKEPEYTCATHREARHLSVFINVYEL